MVYINCDQQHDEQREQDAIEKDLELAKVTLGGLQIPWASEEDHLGYMNDVGMYGEAITNIRDGKRYWVPHDDFWTKIQNT